MKTVFTIISMALATGVASASSSVVAIETQAVAFYNNEEVVIVDGPNMPGNNDGNKFLVAGN
ncbi:hypothetical protein Q4488_09810 [Amphritea sp. 1_MG-2023]|uniref:hypothetical protein n=1 Tax=Amphritea sp. 1_MG-2023 TaxID=3062670 RepID=UPI0026E23A34|nr:hypothetical protein [Amphritea sp. 1_MG-2023]MDO6563679.1 hypothetical protein [Amphritea sp. 1_MG-2023]